MASITTTATKAATRKLSRSMLPALQQVGQVQVPQYDTSKVTGGILHLGVGNFHRSHFAGYMDDLLDSNFTEHQDWGIVGAGIMSFDDVKRNQLESQNWMQTLVEKDGTSAKARILGSMCDFLPVDAADGEHKILRDRLLDPAIRIVSMTVTEGGYFLNDGKFDPKHPLIMQDILNPNSPKTIFGMMVQALKLRKEAGIPPFTIMSCDNIPHNGHVVRSVVIGLAKEMGPELAKWIDENVGFPNSMVDRITPGTTNEQRVFVEEQYGIEDAAPIVCEPFRQWVIEEKFSNGRPAWDKCINVTFVPDVVPYENMKLRILNGGHASLCYPAALLGVQYVHEAMAHPTIGPFLDCLERTEIIPHVAPVPDTSLTEYWDIIAARFENPTIMDTIPRNCYDGPNRQPKFIVPTAADALEAGHSVDGLALVSAMWCRYCLGVTESGEEIPPNDPQWEKLQSLAKEAKENPVAWLSMTDVYGKVGQNPVFQEAFTKALNGIYQDGLEATMNKYTERCSAQTLQQAA